MDKLEAKLLKEIADLDSLPAGAYNIRKNGGAGGRNNTAHIVIDTKTDKSGIDIHIAPGTKHESVHIPVIITETGLTELVYNDFYIGEDCDVDIVAGCGIHNGGCDTSQHDGVHTFHVGKNAKVRYYEKHYGEGEGTGKRIFNPQTIAYLEEGASIHMVEPGRGLHQALHQDRGGPRRRGDHHGEAPHRRRAGGRVRDGHRPGR